MTTNFENENLIKNKEKSSSNQNIIFLSAFPVNILPWGKEDSYWHSEAFTVVFKKRRLDDLIEFIGDKEVYCYIRHLPTVNILRKYFKLVDKGSEQYTYNGKDYIYIFALYIRPDKGKDVEITEEDLLILEVGIAKGSWI